MGPYEIMLALGVFNHVENPLAFLERLYGMTKDILIIDCNCFLSSSTAPFNVVGKSVSEAITGCNFFPSFDYSPGFSFEHQYSKRAVLNYLYRAGFKNIFEIPTPLSQPEGLGYYYNRFFAVAQKCDNPDFWQEELLTRQMYEIKNAKPLVDDDFFILKRRK